MDQAAWLAQVNEPVIEPDLPICDPHHHLWDHPNSRYLLDELLLDTGSGHNVVSTVFVECASMYRADGPEAMKPVGETEFVNGVAAMSASGRYGPIRAAAGIVSLADLTLGSRVGEVLDAHMAVGARFKGIRHAAGWDASDQVRNSHTNPTEGLLLDATFRKGFAELGKRGLSFDAWLYHPQIPQLTDLARAFPGTTIIVDHFAGPLGIGPYEGKGARSVRAVEEVLLGAREVPERRREDRRHRDADQRFRLSEERSSGDVRRTGGRERRLLPPRDRRVRARPLHVREQLSGRQGELLVSNVVEFVQEDRGLGVEGRESGAVSRYRRARVSTGIDTEGVNDEDDC